MCDNDSIDDMLEYDLKKRGLSRREFGALTLGAGVVSMLPAVAGAVETEGKDVEIKTPDGTCDAYFVHPSKGASAAVLVWPDIFGLRPAFKQMGKRLAESGYAVLTINPFYRTHKGPAGSSDDFSDPEKRKTLLALAGSLTPETANTDAKAFIAWLDAQPAVDKKKKMGTTGYCMGGPFVMRTAAAFPNRVGAGATFHGGGLVTDKPDSPHLLVPKMKAHFLFAIAQNDDEKQPEQKTVLKEAFEKAKLPAPEIEVYPAMHGWCPPDSRVYDEAQAEKAWGRLLALFKTSLV
ncbi:MAG TPA: dienelactone hydrolase family protein [Steroidobacteraceae bacterium]|jgi:carboxymethylenebutenolidase|nr:dienelactone hydrolase family protein [Steroidobacteraceae bacterium]